MGLVISAFVYHVPEPPPLVVCSEEVQSAFWVPLPLLRDPARQVDYHFRHELGPLDMPGIRVGDAEPARRLGPHLPLRRELPRASSASRCRWTRWTLASKPLAEKSA